MTALYFTNNPNLGSTARILQSWFLLEQNNGGASPIVVRQAGDFSNWLGQHQIPHLIDPMPWPEKRRPIQSILHPWRVAKWARSQRVDILHSNEHDIYPFVSMVRRLTRLPTVCHVRYKLDAGFAKWAFQGNRCPDALLWTSYQQKQDSAAAIEGIVPEARQHVVRLGIDLSQFGTLAAGRDATRKRWNIEPHQIVIGTASPLRPRKRVHEFVELVARLAAKNPYVVGIVAGQTIAGDEDYAEQIVQQIAATGLGNRLQFLGFLEPIEPFYHACDIVVSTSEYETFGNSVCEAMACGKAIAAYRGGSVQEVVADAGIVVETGDLGALGSAVQSLISDPQLRTSFGRRAQDRVKCEFDPAKSHEQVQSIYNGILMKCQSKKATAQTCEVDKVS